MEFCMFQDSTTTELSCGSDSRVIAIGALDLARDIRHDNFANGDM
jgi:hypothetical protein